MTSNEDEQILWSRRQLFRLGGAAVAAHATLPLVGMATEREPKLQAAIEGLPTWLTAPDRFQDVSRGNPVPHTLSDEAQREAGMTRETWKLEVISDPDHPTRLKRPLSNDAGTALDFDGLMKLAQTKAVRFAKVMTCLNIGCPLGMGIWEGVPLRDVVWMTQPVANLRRIFYYGFHNNQPAQKFQSSLPVSRVLEDPFDLPPVILCYKLNGEWLSPERGGPVRIVVPEAYGFKSVKWLTTVVLSNLYHANDTYANGNNDVDSPLKTFAATISVSKEVRSNESFAITGYAQAGISGLSKVQVWLRNKSEPFAVADDPHFLTAPWRDCEILPPPIDWGGGLPDGKIPLPTQGFDSKSSQPTSWPMRLTKVYWATLLQGLPAGEYTLRCRTIDAKNQPQPLPRPFQKLGHSAIEAIDIRVTD